MHDWRQFLEEPQKLSYSSHRYFIAWCVDSYLNKVMSKEPELDQLIRGELKLTSEADKEEDAEEAKTREF